MEPSGEGVVLLWFHFDAFVSPVKGSFAYTHLALRFSHREQRGRRRSQPSFDLAHAAHDLRSVWPIGRLYGAHASVSWERVYGMKSRNETQVEGVTPKPFSAYPSWASGLLRPTLGLTSEVDHAYTCDCMLLEVLRCTQYSYEVLFLAASLYTML